MSIFHPLLVFNFLIALYSWLLLPLLLEIKNIEQSNIDIIYNVSIFSHFSFTFGSFIAILFFRQKKTRKSYSAYNKAYINYDKRVFSFTYGLLIIYLLFIMQISAGSISYFLSNLDKRQIFMTGWTFLTIPLFLLKFLIFYEYYVSKRINIFLVLKILLTIVVLGLFGRFFAIAFLLQFLIIYFLINKIQYVNMKQILLLFIVFFNVIFVYGIYRYYTGVVSIGQFSGSFINYLLNMDMVKVSAILATNFFDGADVLNKMIQVVDNTGYLYGLTFFVAIFKILPKLNGIVTDLVIPNLGSEFQNADFGQQVFGLVPELYLNFGYIGLLIFIPFGFFTTYIFKKSKASFFSIVMFAILYVNFIQLMRNGSAVFITFLWVDFIMLVLFIYIKRIKFK